MSDDIQTWIATRPECVQEMARKFPHGSAVMMPEGRTAWLVGWSEPDSLLLSFTSPHEDYDRAVKERFPVCCSHFEEPGDE